MSRIVFQQKKKIQPWSRGWGDFTICPISAGESPLWVLVPHPRASVLGHVCSTVQEQEITEGVFPTNKHFCSLFLALSSPSPRICLGLFILSKTHLHPISICQSRQILFNFIFLLEKNNYLELFNVLLWDRFFHFSNLIPFINPYKAFPISFFPEDLPAHHLLSRYSLPLDN